MWKYLFDWCMAQGTKGVCKSKVFFCFMKFIRFSTAMQVSRVLLNNKYLCIVVSFSCHSFRKLYKLAEPIKSWRPGCSVRDLAVTFRYQRYAMHTHTHIRLNRNDIWLGRRGRGSFRVASFRGS